MLSQATCGRADLDAKRCSNFSKLADNRLTLAELEAATCLGLTGLLALHLTRVTSHEAFCAKSLLVFGIDLNESTSNGQAKGLALAGEATTIEVHLDVILFSSFEESKGLLDYKLEDGRGEVFSEVTFIDGDLTSTLGQKDTGHGALATAQCVDHFHVSELLKGVNINGLGALCFVLVFCAGVDIEIAEKLSAETVLGEHTLNDTTDEFVCSIGLCQNRSGSVLTLTTGIACVGEINAVGHLLTRKDKLVRVDDNNVVTAVYVRSKVGLVLTTEELSDF